jgi:putative ABC transport system permease protein
MPILDAIRLALKMIWAQKLKSSFSVIGVFVGVTFLIAVVTIVEGMNQYMKDTFSSFLGANTFQVRRFEDFRVGDTTREQWLQLLRRPQITFEDARALAAGISTPTLIAWESQTGADLTYRGAVATGVRVIGATEHYFAIRSWNIEHGRAFSDQEVQAGRPVVVIGSEIARGLFEGLDPIGREIKIRRIPYRVIGVVEEQGNVFGLSLDKFAVAPALSPLKRFVNPPNVIDQLLVRADNQELMQAALIEAEAIMRSRRGLRPTEENDFALETSDAILGFWGRINQIMLLALPGLVGVSLVVGGIVIMNIMLMSVTERTREIGIRKSLGARRRDIRRQFLVESATLAVCGAVLGILTGLGLARVVEAASPLPAEVAPWSIVAGVVLGAGVGIAAGLYPAARAARMDPVNAMRME